MSTLLTGVTIVAAVAGACEAPSTILDMARCNPSLDCERADSTMEMSQCAALRLAAADSEMTAAFEKLLESLVEEQRIPEQEQLAISQDAWKRYRTSYCSAIYESYGMGSIRGIAYSNCMIERAILRRDELRQYADPEG